MDINKNMDTEIIHEIKNKILEENDIDLMVSFMDDGDTKYKKETLIKFIKDENAYGFVTRNEKQIIGFAYGYKLYRPDGKQDFYLHSIDIMEGFQGKGYGTELINFIKIYIKKIGCRKMFLITNKSNISACKCYEKAGGINKANDDIVYVY